MKKRMPKNRKTIIALCAGVVVIIAIVTTVLLVGFNKNDSTAGNTVSDLSKTSDTASIKTSDSAKATKDSETGANTDKYISEKNYSDGEVGEDGTFSGIDLNYPVASEEEFGDGANTFNEIIEANKDALVNDYLRERAMSSEDASNFSYTSDYDVYHRTDGYLSVLLRLYITGDTEHSTAVYSSVNFDTNTQESIAVPPYCKCDVDTFDYIASSLIENSIQNDSNGYYSEVVSNYSPYYYSAKMVFDDSKVSFIYEPGSIAPYTYGERVFEYSYSEFN